MQILRQASLEQDKIYRNGAQKTVHAVIKNLPFEVELRAGQSVDFNRHTVTAALLYDDGDEGREVHFVKAAPIEYNCSVGHSGKAVVVEVKLSVLSSQHEDMLFRIKFSAADTAHSIMSEAIKVVSKPAQLKKNRAAKARGQKRPLNASVQESLLRIEAQQRDQQALLASLTNTLSSITSSTSSHQQPAAKKSKAQHEADATARPPREQFEDHLAGLVGAYSNLERDQRAEVVRRVIRSAPVHHTETISELIDSLWAEGLHRGVGHNVDTGSPYAGEASDSSTSQWSPTTPTAESDFDPNNFYDELFGSARSSLPLLHEGDYHP